MDFEAQDDGIVAKLSTMVKEGGGEVTCRSPIMWSLSRTWPAAECIAANFFSR